MSENDPPIVTDGSMGRTLLEAAIRGYLVLFIVVVIGAVHTFTQGISFRNGTFLFGGVSSVLGLLGCRYLILIWVEKGRQKKSIYGWLFAISISVPIAFAAYILFFEGLWGGVRAFSPFSFASIFFSLLYFIAGKELFNAAILLKEFRELIEIRENFNQEPES